MTIVESMKFCFSLKRNILIFQFYLQCILIYLLSETASEISVNSHCCTNNLVHFFPK